ncbi:hypothetical protein IWX58_004803 [Rubrivivax gelatinosus]|uniref:hypothetical protein n=1 Tax=Rubrivivax gelatinosus TaxID=28068 RepID=UPI0018C9FBA5|nr:hypothetical protein [Rubrivivax gelatinosus]MBG6083053.1 hypothetical protein [Rubrivivax gelatinosus]
MFLPNGAAWSLAAPGRVTGLALVRDFECAHALVELFEAMAHAVAGQPLHPTAPAIRRHRNGLYSISGVPDDEAAWRRASAAAGTGAVGTPCTAASAFASTLSTTHGLDDAEVLEALGVADLLRDTDR